MSKKKKICILLITLVVLWLIMGITDFIKVHNFEKPLFCIETNSANDDGFGHYIGLGYSVDIEGYFASESELFDITEFNFYVFGLRMESGLRD